MAANEADVQGALHLLRTGRTGERAAAARLLADWGTQADVPALTQACRRELDHYVVRAIEEAIERSSARGRDPVRGVTGAPSASPEAHEDPESRALREATSMLVHELQLVVGQARLAAERELALVEGNDTTQVLKRLADLLDAIETLGSVARPARVVQFDLSSLVGDIAAEHKERCGVAIELLADDGIIASGDPRLVEFVVRNAILNACESSGAMPDENRRPVTVNWDATDRDAWVAVLDFGDGLLTGVEHFGFAKSSKEDHLGVGLTIARRAATSLGGAVALVERDEGGVTCRLSWKAA